MDVPPQAERERQQDSFLEDKPTTGISRAAQSCRRMAPRTALALVSTRSNPPLPPIPFLSANISTSPHRLLPASPAVVSPPEVGRGCLERWQAEKTLQEKDSSPQHVAAKLAGSQTIQPTVFSPSLIPVFCIHTTFPALLPPALPHPHADVRQQQASSPRLIAGSAHSGSQLPHEK